MAGGAPANSDGSPSSGQTVDQQVAAQGGAAESVGDGGRCVGASGGGSRQPPPSASTSDGKVSVAAAVGVNVGVSTT